MAQLLEGSGLTARRSASGAIVVALAESPPEETSTLDPRRQTNAPPPIVVEEVIVRGSRFQQSLIDRIPIDPQELPYTLNRLDREFLDQRNFSRPFEVLATLPNVVFGTDQIGTGSGRVFSRGFDADVLVDNRRQNGFRGAGRRDESFIESYEVLKGPASIALGPVGTGGIVNTVTRAPQEDRFYAFELRGDHFGTFESEFDLNFGDTLGADNMLFRVSGAYRKRQFDADEPFTETIAIRPVATFELGQATSAKVSFAYVEQDIRPNPGFPRNSDGSIPNVFDTDTFTGFQNVLNETDDLYFDGQIVHEFSDDWKLTVRGSHQETDVSIENDTGFVTLTGLDPTVPVVFFISSGGLTEQTSEVTFVDTQLAYQAEAFGQTHDFVVGVSYDDVFFTRSTLPFEGIGGPLFPQDFDEPRFLSPSSGQFNLFDEQVLELYSAFAEAAVRPTDWLTLVAGVRHDDIEIDSTRGGFDSLLAEDETTFRVGASAEVAQGINVYASFAESFQPSTNRSQRDGSLPDPIESIGYEVGAKGSWFDNRMRLEGAAFYTLRQNLVVTDPNNELGEDFVVTIGEIRLQGLELSADLAPLEGLHWSVDIGFLDVDVLEAGQDEVTEPTIPEFTASSYLSYELQSTALAGLRLGGGFRFNDSLSGTTTKTDSYIIADLNLSYPVGEHVVMSFDVLNAFDERYLDQSAALGDTVRSFSTFGPPRTFVLTMRAKY
ncbi:MAG: TonB-dependent siderophore receptor [Pseudomonadota bacterium]